MMRALRAAQLRSASSPSSRRPPVGQPSRCLDAVDPRGRSSIAMRAKTKSDFEFDEELQRRPPGHPLAFGEPPSTSFPSSSSADAPLSWPSLDLAFVAAALARSEEARSGGEKKGRSRLPGGVHLVGTGPGDAGLLTLRAVALLASADVVLYDRLVSPEILALVNPAARMVYVGKSKGLHTRSQEEIHDLLVAFASSPPPEEEEGDGGENEDGGSGGGGGAKQTKKHPIVLRLKGGDPLVFGRGGEEATALREAGIPVHTVPGISAAGGVAASLGIPLTHRGVATSVRLLTGHARPGGERGLEEDLERVARSPDCENTTLVIYMGLSTLPETSKNLVRCGMQASTPAVAVERGTTARQRVIYSTVRDLPAAVARAELVSPTLIIIGGVVALSPGWQEEFGEEGGSKGQSEDDSGDEDDADTAGVSSTSFSSSAAAVSAAASAADLAAAA